MDTEKYYEKIKNLRYIRRTMPEIITRHETINGEECCLIFDDLQSKFYKLKGNASRIWEMLKGERTVDMIVEEMSGGDPEKQEVVRRDVCRFIAKIGKKELIKAAVKKAKPKEMHELEDSVDRTAIL